MAGWATCDLCRRKKRRKNAKSRRQEQVTPLRIRASACLTDGCEQNEVERLSAENEQLRQIFAARSEVLDAPPLGALPPGS